MTHRVFEIPEYHEFVDALGVGPEHLGEGVLRLDFKIADEELGFTLDQPGRSVHLRWLRGSMCVLEIFREGGVQVGFVASDGASALVVGFRIDSLGGDLAIQTDPAFRITDRLLLQ
jgi:hypothetical protein